MASDHYSDRLTFENLSKLQELEFAASTPETMDTAIFNWVNDKCDLHTNTSKGWKKVPVIWVGAERAHQIKANKDLRDSGGMLILPMMAIDRVSITKDPSRMGSMPANLQSTHSKLDPQGGSIVVARRIKQDKTSAFRTAAQKQKFSGGDYDGDTKPNRGALKMYVDKQDGRIVYETISMPMPVRVLVEYKLSIQTDFHTQMNEILQGMHSNIGNHSWIRCSHETHIFDAKIEDFSFNNNLATLEEEERVLRTDITIKLEGYIIGGGENDPKPKLSIRENAVSIFMPRESVMLVGAGTVPEEFIRYSSANSLRSVREMMAGQVHFGKVHTTSSGAGVDEDDVIKHEDFITLQAVVGTLNGTNKTFTLTSNPRAGTVTLVHNGLVLTPGATADYTISSNTITLDYAPEDGDRLVASYVKNS